MTNPIQILHTIDDIKEWRRAQRGTEKIAFVPTMGSLHAGHLALFEHAGKQADIVIGSIFVNPSQFAPHEDLDQYPRSLEKDIEALNRRIPPSALFVPAVSTMYPSGITTDINQQAGTFVNVEKIGQVLEGVKRPHFFRGVCTVVVKLLNLVRPHVLVLGQKDMQQCIILKAVIKDLFLDTEVIVVPTVRLPSNQLALSSRNQYLSEHQVALASSLAKGLIAAQSLYWSNTRSGRETRCQDLVEVVRQSIAKADPSSDSIAVEYIQVTDEALTPVAGGVLDPGARNARLILFGAIVLGSVRLIDNVYLE